MEQYRVLAPHDSHDTQLAAANVDYLRQNYPEVPEWYNRYYFPAAIPVPLPPVVFYYHNRIRNAAALEEQQIWNNLLEYEVAVMFAAGWWHEAARGHRAWIIPEDTIVWLEERLGNLPLEYLEGGRHITFNCIAQRMRDANGADRAMRNILQPGRGTTMEDHFVPTTWAFGYVDNEGVCGRSLRRNNRGRLVFTDSNDEYAPRLNRRRRNNEGRYTGTFPDRRDEQRPLHQRYPQYQRYDQPPVDVPQQRQI